AEPRSADLLVGDEIVRNRFGDVGRNAEADVLRDGAAHDSRVDADDLAFQVEERASGVALVDGGVCLNEVDIVVDIIYGAAYGGDDAEGDCVIVVQRAADGNGEFAGAKFRGRTHG